MMKRNVAAEAREVAKAEKEATRAEKEATKKAQANKKQTSTVETAKALKALKELLEEGILSQEEYQLKRQDLIDQL